MDEIAKTFQQRERHEFQERGGFATGNHEAVDVVEVFGLADEGDGRPEFFEAAAVGVEIALES